MEYLRAWDCLSFYSFTDTRRTNIRPRALKRVFVGYSEDSKAHRILDLSLDVIIENGELNEINSLMILKLF